MKNKQTSVNSKGMNVLLWILQILFAFYYLTGGIYMMSHYEVLGNVWALNTLPKFFWVALASIEILLAVGLIFPRKLIHVSAAGLAVISLSGIVLYAAYVGSGILWAVLPAVLLSFISYRRGYRN